MHNDSICCIFVKQLNDMKKVLKFLFFSTILSGLFLYVQAYIEFKKVNPMTWHTGMDNSIPVLPDLLWLWFGCEVALVIIYILLSRNKND